MNKKQKMFGTGKHRKMIVASTIAWMTLVSWMFNVNAQNLQVSWNSSQIQNSTTTKQKVWVKKVFHTQDPEIQEAIENDNYEKFVSLTSSDITKDKFEQIVKKYIFHTSIQQAIENNNYRDFQIASKWTDLQTVSEEEFEEMVSKSIARKTGL